MGNKLKPLSPPPPVRSNEELSMRAEHLGSIVERVEAKTKCDNSVAEINHQLVVLQNSLTRIENVVSKFNSCQSTIDKHIASIGSLNESVGSAVVNIEKAIDKAGKVKVTIRLDPKHLQQLEAYKQDIVEQEKKVREDFFLKEEERIGALQRHSQPYDQQRRIMAVKGHILCVDGRDICPCRCSSHNLCRMACITIQIIYHH